MKLEYIIVYKSDGLPIYSKCFGTFCAIAGTNEVLLTGFLSALMTIPEMFGENMDLKSVEMGYTKLILKRTMPSGVSIAVGIVNNTYDDKKHNTKIETFFEMTKNVLDKDYKDKNWSHIKQNELKEFEEKLIHNAILPNFPYFTDRDVCGDNCPFEDVHNYEQSKADNLQIWEVFKLNYNKPLPFIKRIFAGIYLNIYHWIDMRKYYKKKKLM
ncbi:MAG: hypothetical protein OEY49_08205 [Candidatus Heimdallarchaeota archaeon]|nr:hypothetical protein [Candidatus Heimdallarchaeota archaeon]